MVYRYRHADRAILRTTLRARAADFAADASIQLGGAGAAQPKVDEWPTVSHHAPATFRNTGTRD
jgi:hypothetical protein